VRNGPYGVGALNHLAEQILQLKGLIERPGGPGSQWYHGKPVMITRNHYQLGLYNGDTGLVQMASSESNQPGSAAATPRLVIGDFRQAIRIIPAFRIGSCETAFAITVHKSQGSEFDRVHLILPDVNSPVLTRELLYTAITRARHSVKIWGTESILRSTIKRRIKRSSGLKEALWGQG
jgi:exodeoxyribonuclease V alpha subunit